MTGGGGRVRQRFIFYTPKNPNFRICLPKKIPQCFCISKFYYLSSGKLKHANFNFGFGKKQNYKLRLCYFWFELMKNTIPKKIPVLFSRPKKILRTPPVIKICERGPWVSYTSTSEICLKPIILRSPFSVDASPHKLAHGVLPGIETL